MKRQKNLNDKFAKAMHKRDFVLARKLLVEGADVNVVDNTDGSTQLFVPARDNDLKGLEFLL